jgi:hypothetical protein
VARLHIIICILRMRVLMQTGTHNWLVNGRDLVTPIPPFIHILFVTLSLDSSGTKQTSEGPAGDTKLRRMLAGYPTFARFCDTIARASILRSAVTRQASLSLWSGLNVVISRVLGVSYRLFSLTLREHQSREFLGGGRSKQKLTSHSRFRALSPFS